MKPRAVVSIAAALFWSAVLACGPSGTRTFESIDKNWQIMVERSSIPEAGGYHPYLWRNSEHVHVIVDRDTYEYKVVGDDCVVWLGLDSDGLYIACGDHQPLLMTPAGRFGYAGDLTVAGDTVSIYEDKELYFEGSLREWKHRAEQQPPIKNSWNAEALHAM
jgi:hypothetical protein